MALVVVALVVCCEVVGLGVSEERDDEEEGDG